MGSVAFAWIPILCTIAASLVWQERKHATLAGHPMIGRTIVRQELLAISQLVQHLPSFRLCKEVQVVYLIQGEEDTSAAETAIWGGGWDVFVLTFQRFRQDALFFPESILAEGRNMLLVAALLQNALRGCSYTYYVMLDADVQLLPSWALGLKLFNAFLDEWTPAIGLPAYEHEGVLMVAPEVEGSSHPVAVYNFDNIFMAIHVEAVPLILPYSASFDVHCSWTSQWMLSLLASVLFRNHVLVLASVIVRNLNHSEYTLEHCEETLADASQSLRMRVPVASHACFPDPDSCFAIPSGTIPLPPGATELGAVTFWPARWPYLPWGVAQRRNEKNYTSSRLENVSPCDHTILRMGDADWLAVLRGTIKADPFSLQNWHALAVSSGVAGDPYFSLGLFEIVRRLFRFYRAPLPAVIRQNIEDLQSKHRLIHAQTLFASLWSSSGREAAKLVHTALVGELAVGEEPLANHAGLEDFVQVLASGLQQA